MFGSSLSPVVCKGEGGAHVLFTLFVFVCAQWCPTYVVLCCVVFLLCFSSSFVPYVASFS